MTEQTESSIKENILNRLHERVGVCIHCGKPNCPHGTNTNLPPRLSADDVLWAINLDNFFERRDE